MSVEVLERLSALLDDDSSGTSSVSMRLPSGLRDAAALAVTELGTAPSVTALTVGALRSVLEMAALRAVLDGHFEQYPQARPDLAQTALALAQQTGSPLARKRRRLRAAAAQIVRAHPAATAREVLLWAEAQEAVSGGKARQRA